MPESGSFKHFGDSLAAIFSYPTLRELSAALAGGSQE
jgi:hypothetical protein